MAQRDISMSMFEEGGGIDICYQLALDKSRETLVGDLDIKGAADYLVSKYVLTLEEYERVTLPGQTSFDQRRSLLGLFPKKSQEALSTFCEFLQKSQPWLHDIVVTNYKNITEEDVINYKRYNQMGVGPSRQELQEGLTHKLRHFVKNDPSRIIKNADEGIYIEQSIRLEAKQNEHFQQDEHSTGNILSFLSSATPGERIIVYGGAGMGKSTFCREVTKTWVDCNSEIRKRFDYIFPIPLRSLQSCDLIDVICRDLGLIPESCKKRLQQDLELIPTRILCILDSYEEQCFQSDDAFINKLFRRELFPESTVILTSRPNTNIQRLQSRSQPCTAVHLQGLTANQTEEYLKSYPNLQQDICSKIEQKFGLIFLQCPMNLWLMCNLLADTAMTGEIELPETQTALLNHFMQHIMLAYVKKKKLPEFKTSAESPMEIENAPEARSILSTLGRLCYTAIKKKEHVLKIGQEVLSFKDVMEVGLFTEGKEKNSVALPHPIFQEYLTALHLSSDRLARENVVLDIFSELKCSTEKRSLDDVLGSQGLKEIIRFLVGLLPTAAENFYDLFAIKERNVKGMEGARSALQPDLQYELGLLKECPDTGVKKDIAMALLNAPVISDSRPSTEYVANSGSYELLRYFTEEQCLLFLKRAYNIDKHFGERSLFVKHTGKEMVLDTFAVGFSHLYDYSVEIPTLNIVHSPLPLRLLQENMAAVRCLHLFKCALCDQLQQYQSSFNIAVKRTRESQTEKDLTPLEILCLDDVIFLHATSKFRSTQELGITVTNRDTLELAKMKILFEEVKKVKISGADLVYPSNGNWSSVTDLALWECLNVDIGQLSKVFPNVESMLFGFVAVQLRACGIQWPAVRYLRMFRSYIDSTDRGHLRRLKANDALKYICRQALQLDLTKYEECLEPSTGVVALYNYSESGNRFLSFRKGEFFIIVRETKYPMWVIARNWRGNEGMIPTNYVTRRKNIPLESMPWYHGRITRDDCRKRLSSSKVGTYLITDNNNWLNDYTLCVRYGDDIEYYRIIAKDNKMTLDKELYFSCLPRLVEHYGRAAYGLYTKLEHYVSVQGQPRVTVDEAAFLEKHWIIEAENIELQDCFWRWKHGDVFRWEYFGQSVLVERPNQTRQREGILVEAAVMTALQHQNVAKFMGVILGDTIQLVKENFDQGPLRQYLRTKATEVTKEQQLMFARDICHGMIHLEEKGFLHRCLKASHVWVHKDGTAKDIQGLEKVLPSTGFQLFNLWQARPVDSNQLQPPPVVAVRWASPEVLQSDEFSTKSDMWSFGVVLWEIYTLGKEPFPSLEKGNVREMLQHLKQGHRLQIPTDCPQSVADIMKEAWAADPADRPTFNAVQKRLAEDQTQGVAIH